MDLGYVLRRAWEVTWRHKVLWFFGFLVSLGIAGRRVGIGSGGRWGWPVRELPPEVQRAIADLLSSSTFTVVIVALVLLALAVGIGLALLGALGRAALVDQVQAAEEQGVVSLGAGWQVGRQHLWMVFLIRLVLGLPAGVVASIGVLPVAGTGLMIVRHTRPEVAIPGVLAMPVVLLACLLPAVCVAALLSVPFGVLRRLAVRACVLEGCGVRQSIVRAWAMLREQVGPLALVWLILFGTGIGVTIVVALPLALVALSVVAVALLAVFVSPILPVALVLIGGLLIWLVGAACNSVAETFGSAVWTLAYRELIGLGLTGEEAASAE